ncbi:hypothetical protein, partial [Acidovorax sp. Root217]|uniref:hypothetical protein n=1 Tax=Acidovorax sp. Root217 TaxID=1736492 RepID=UPI001F2FEAE2
CLLPRTLLAPVVPARRAVAQLMAVLPCLALLTACQGQTDLAASGCLPLRVPAQVVLVQEAGLYAVGRDANGKTLVLSPHPRNTANDDFHGTRLVRTLAPGTRLGIDRLQQAWGFDVGKGRISAFGTVAGGERFEYGWGGGTVIGRAPWEPATVPHLRTVACGD